MKKKGRNMKFLTNQSPALCAAAIALNLLLWITSASAAENLAQMQQPQAQEQPAPSKTAPASGQAAQQMPPVEPPKADPAEAAAYKAFFDLKPEDLDKQIQSGEEFLKKYPESHYRQVVYSRLTQAYFGKQEMDKMFASGDKAIRLNPDDVSVLALIGWVLPHNINPNDSDTEQKIAKSEQYSKHAIELLDTMPKPEGLTDDAFSKAKAEALSRSHSGLGLDYFRLGQFAESVTELQQATQLVPNPDPVDLFIIGVDLQNLKRYGDAVTAFQKCAEMPGQLQDRCKQFGEQSKRMAATETPKKP
jgi:tetratricopeptide (TPR) repeat protein